MALAQASRRRSAMRQIRSTAVADEKRGDGPLADLLEDYEFEVCSDSAAFEAALAVRRRVYNDACGYDVPVPDAYDRRSWLLIARHVESGEAVGTMRITPRSAGRLEAEEYFWLPPKLRTTRSVEVNRFAILREHRRGNGVMPAVSFGLFKLMMNFVMNQLGAEYIVVCSTEERIWTYEWLRFQRSGIVARYAKLGNKEHELLTMDLRRRLAEHSDHRLFEFIFDAQHREVSLPTVVPGLGPDGHNPH